MRFRRLRRDPGRLASGGRLFGGVDLFFLVDTGVRPRRPHGAAGEGGVATNPVDRALFRMMRAIVNRPPHRASTSARSILLLLVILSSPAISRAEAPAAAPSAVPKNADQLREFETRAEG